MKKIKAVKQRNQFVVLALLRRAGSHRKTNKALRKQLNRITKKTVDE